MTGSGEPTEDEDAQQAVATIWRPTLEAIVASMSAGDWQLSSAPACVERVPEDLAQSMQQIVAAYGDVTLAPLPPETWETSVALWMGTGWQVIVDLWSSEEGRTDLVLDAFVEKVADGYEFRVHLVYVP